MDLHDKVALITGGASGLGKATAFALAERGASIVVADVDELGGEAVAAQVGGRFVRCDVSKAEDNDAAVAAAVDAFGGLDMAYLNAGIASGCGIAEHFDIDKYRRAMAINLDGVVFGCNAVIPALRERGGGAIVATASLAGLTGVPLDPIYAANKHAVVGLVRSLGIGLQHEGIRVNAICPGFSESNIIKDIREAIVESGLAIIPAEKVADAVRQLFEGDMSGECWYVQPGRPAEAFGFRRVPGPRPEGEPVP